MTTCDRTTFEALVNLAQFLTEVFLHLWRIASNWLLLSLPIESIIALPALLLAVLIPVAILLIDKKDAGYEWDKAVILTKVLDSRALFGSILILGAAPLFWRIHGLQILVLLVFVIGLFALINSILSSYKWLIVTEGDTMQDSYRTQKRIEYLGKLDDSQKTVIWSLTWNKSKSTTGLIDHRELVKIFTTSISEMSDKTVLGPSALRDFMANLENLDLTDPIIHEHLVNFSMQWASSLASPKQTDSRMLGFQVTARRLYFAILKRDLQDGSGFGAYLLYHDTQAYLKTNKIKDAKFVKYFSVEFLSCLDTLDRSDHIWDEFPSDWLVTVENLSLNKDTALAWLNAYLRWVSGRNISAARGDGEFRYDSIADNVTRQLLPKVDIGIWSDLIVFHWSPFGSSEGETTEHAQIRGFVERDKRFGLIGRMHEFWPMDGKESVEDNYREALDNELKETIQLCKMTTAFPVLLNKPALSKYLDEIASFKYPEASNEHLKLMRLKSLLELFQDE